jgi:hypothetical protein
MAPAAAQGRPRRLPARVTAASCGGPQHRELVAQHQDLQVLGGLAAGQQP